MRSPSANRDAICSCRRVSRRASPWIAATAQIRRAPRKRANFFPSASPPFTPRSARLARAPGPWGRSGRRQQLLDALDRRNLVDALDRGEFAHQPIEGGLIDLALAVGLLGLAHIAEQVAHHLGDRSGVARRDLRL